MVLHTPDRSKCVHNFNEMSKYSKTIMFDKVTRNSTQVKCEINFGSDLKFSSSSYIIIFSGFLKIKIFFL